MNNTVVTAQFQSMKAYLKMVMITDLVKTCLFCSCCLLLQQDSECSCIPVWSTTAGSCTYTAFTTAIYTLRPWYSNTSSQWKSMPIRLLIVFDVIEVLFTIPSWKTYIMQSLWYTLKTSMLVENEHSIFTLLREVSHSQINFGTRIQSEWELLLSSEGNNILSQPEWRKSILNHFKFLRVYQCCPSSLWLKCINWVKWVQVVVSTEGYTEFYLVHNHYPWWSGVIAWVANAFQSDPIGKAVEIRDIDQCLLAICVLDPAVSEC